MNKHIGWRQSGWLFSLGVFLLTMMGCAAMPKIEEQNPTAWRQAMQPPLAEADKQRMANGLRMADALILGASRNPRVQAERFRWRAMIESEPQATSLPDPMAMAGKQFADVDPMMDFQEWQAGITQTIPWWQKLVVQGKKAGTDALIMAVNYEATVRDLVIDIKDTYYELYYLDRALQITELVETLLRNEALLAYQEIAIGRTQLNEGFRAESWAAQLAYDRILLVEQRNTQAERLRSLLNLPPGTEIGAVRDCPLYPVTNDIDSLYSRAEAYSSVLKIRGMETMKARYDVILAQMARIPDINLGFDFMKMPMGPDSWVGLFSMNLPIWEQRNQAMIHEKKALEEAARLQSMNETNQVRSAIAKAYFSVQLSHRLSRLYADTLLPQADSIMQQAEILFRNDQASFSTLIESTLAYHNFQLAFHRALADEGQSIGRLEQVLGTTAESDFIITKEQD